MSLAFTFIGTIIGAGFASGQEIKKYFVDFGSYGLIGIIFVTIIFIVIGERIMLMGYTSKADSYDKILWYGFKCKFRRLIDYILIFCLVSTASTMFSGTGAFLQQDFNIPFIIGALIMMVVTFFITILGIEKIVKVSSFIVPILIFITCIISIKSLKGVDFLKVTLINEVSPKGIFPALFSAIIYGAYNIVMGLSVLPVLGNNAKNKKGIKIVSILSGLIIGIFGVIIYFALFANYDKIQASEIPISVLTNSSYKFLYGISFIIAVLTTAVGCLYGIYTRFNKNIYIFSGICIISYIISLYGFSTLVSKLYYAMGIFGIFLIVMLLMGYNISENRRKNKKMRGIKNEF